MAADNRKFLRFFMWCSTVLFLIAAWLYVWNKKTEPEAVKAAFVIAQKQILTNANNYKQQWLVSKQPSTINIDGIEVHYTVHGWPIVLTNGQVDCEKWLSLLWPDKKFFGQHYYIYHLNKSDDNIFCDYVFKNNHTLYLQLVNGAFGANIKYDE